MAAPGYGELERGQNLTSDQSPSKEMAERYLQMFDIIDRLIVRRRSTESKEEY